jgi:hypothetical protein
MCTTLADPNMASARVGTVEHLIEQVATLQGRPS